MINLTYNFYWIFFFIGFKTSIIFAMRSKDIKTINYKEFKNLKIFFGL